MNVVCGAGTSVGEALLCHSGVDLVAFTGSDLVGDRVKAVTGETGKKVLLDLSGKSANLVLDDADLDLAVAGTAWASFFHNGQICMAGSRIIVSRRRYADFVGLLAEQAAQLRLGDPLDTSTDLGPLISRQQVRIVHRYVKIGVAEGARLVCGGSKPDAGELPNQASWPQRVDCFPSAWAVRQPTAWRALVLLMMPAWNRCRNCVILRRMADRKLIG